MAKAVEQEQTWVSIAEFIQIAGCSELELRNLSRKNILPKIVDERVAFVPSLQRLIAHLREPDLSQTEAAGILQVTPAWIRQMINQGYMTLKSNGLIASKDVSAGYIRYLKDEKRQQARSAGVNKVTAARAAEIELRIAMKQRELIPLEDAMLAFSDLCGFCRQSMDGLAARITRDLALRKLIQKEANAVLQEISTRSSECARAMATGGDALEAGDGDDPGPVGSEEPHLSQDSRGARTA